MAQYIPYQTIDEAHDRSRDWWLAILGRAKNPDDVTEFVYDRRQRTGDPEADADLPDGIDVAIVVAERDEWLDALVRDDEMQPREAGEVAELYPAWALGNSYAVDDLVQYEGALYKCRQAHRATDAAWVPTNVPALWLVYRKNADDLLAWVAGERVRVGTQRTYEGVTYDAIQAHVTQADWQPPNVPALWHPVAEPTEEWAPGVAYTIGDVVTYQGAEYQCRQSHVSQAGWTPVAVLSLWLPL